MIFPIFHKDNYIKVNLLHIGFMKSSMSGLTPSVLLNK